MVEFFSAPISLGQNDPIARSNSRVLPAVNYAVFTVLMIGTLHYQYQFHAITSQQKLSARRMVSN